MPRTKIDPTPEALAMGERIRRWMEAHDMSAAELARRCKKDASTVRGWLNGYPPAHPTMVLIAGAFGVDLGTFFGPIPTAEQVEQAAAAAELG